MQIHALQTVVNQQINQLGHAEQAGSLANKGAASAGVGASSPERAFAHAVFEQVRNISLNQQEVAGLLPHIANFTLHQDKGGGAILAGLRSDQLSLADAKLLLDAATRQLPPAKPDRPAKPAPAIPPRQQNNTVDLCHHFAGQDVQVLASKPGPGSHSAAIWPSASKPGQFGVFIPGEGMKHAPTLADAKRQLDAYSAGQQTKQLEARWGGAVSVLAEKPAAGFDRPAIWPSASKPGSFGIQIPGKSAMRAEDLAKADSLFAKYGIAARLSDGQHIQVAGTNLPETARVALERQHQIAITPITINGKEIAYLFSGQQQLNRNVLFSSHGSGINASTFTKPEGIEFDFASTRNNVLVSNTMAFAEKLKDGLVGFHDESQIYDTLSREATNYRLDGGIRTRPEQAAELIGRMNRNGAEQPFDFVLLNREAKGVHFADLLQGFKDTVGWLPDQLVCHFCRPQDENKGHFNVSNNYLG
jgi:hypothetical protein